MQSTLELQSPASNSSLQNIFKCPEHKKARIQLKQDDTNGGRITKQYQEIFRETLHQMFSDVVHTQTLTVLQP